MEEQTSYLGIILSCLMLALIIANPIIMIVAYIRRSTKTIIMSAIVCFINLIGAGFGAFSPADGPEGGEAAGRGVCGLYFLLMLIPQIIIFVALFRRLQSMKSNSNPTLVK